MAWFLFLEIVQVVVKKMSKSPGFPFSMSWFAMSKMSIFEDEMSIIQSYHEAQVCLAWGQSRRAWEVVSMSLSHKLQNPEELNPLRWILSMVGRPFIHACQAKILTFGGTLNCQFFFRKGEVEWLVVLSPLPFHSTTLIAM